MPIADTKRVGRVLAVDPGLLSGVAIFDFITPETLTLSYSGELPWNELGELAEREIAAHKTSMAVVCERFTITAKTAQNSQAPWSLECIGMLQWLAYKHDAGDFTLQAVNEAKNMFPNDRLKTLDYWHRGGEGHARDAIRHGLLYSLTQLGWRDPRLLQ